VGRTERHRARASADPEDIAAVTGTFRLGEDSSLSTPYGGGTYQRTITVTAVHLHDGTDLP
jgi:hypothetical protein